MDHTPPSLDDQNAALAALLIVLRALSESFTAVYGLPAQMMRGKVNYGAVRDRALRWLHDMRCVARRLVFIRALQFGTPPAADEPIKLAATWENSGRCPTEKPTLPRSDDPATWAVRYSPGSPHDAKWLKSETPGRRGERAGCKIHLFDADDPRPIAEQFEAILRVIADPDYYAAQLAARVHRWRGRMLRLEKFLNAMCGPAPVFDEAKLDEAHWQTFGAARKTASAMLPLYLRSLESG